MDFNYINMASVVNFLQFFPEMVSDFDRIHFDMYSLEDIMAMNYHFHSLHFPVGNEYPTLVKPNLG